MGNSQLNQVCHQNTFDLELLLYRVIAEMAVKIKEDQLKVIIREMPTIRAYEEHIFPLFQNLRSNTVNFRSCFNFTISV
jgi:light-regulated signal transduction histidine kinase (bacteriophytochrome)